MNQTTKDFDQYYKEFVEDTEQYSDYKLELENLVRACFDKEKDLSHIILWGKTPSFNDGEPCYHTEEVILIMNGNLVYECCDLEYYSTEGFADDKKKDNNKLIFQGEERAEIIFDKNLSFESYYKMPDLANKIYKLLSNQKFSSGAYYTNYVVLIEKKEDKVSFKHYDYYMGY